MNENDYIAEYVREKHPSVLGLDYTIWKFKRSMIQAATEMTKIFKQISPEELRKALQESEAEDERTDIDTDIRTAEEQTE